jgi:hypothetical protein
MFKAEIVAGLIALGGFSLGAQAMTLISPTIENGKSLQNAQIYNGWGWRLVALGGRQHPGRCA